MDETVVVLLVVLAAVVLWAAHWAFNPKPRRR